MLEASVVSRKFVLKWVLGARESNVKRVGGFLAVGRPVFAALTQYESVEVCCGKLTQWHVAWMVSVLV